MKKDKTNGTKKKATPKKVAKKAVAKKKPVSVKKPKENREQKNSKGNKRGMNEASQANLKTTAGPGRPPGKLNYDTRVDLAIERLAQEMADQHNKKPENKDNQIKAEDIDIEGDIFMQHLNNARKGGRHDIDSYLDRRFSKPTVKIEHTGKDGDPIVIEQRKAEKKKAARSMLDKWTKKVTG